MQRSRVRQLLGGLVMAACASPALALDPFYLKVDVNPGDGLIEISQGYSSISAAIDQIDFQELKQRVPTYAGTEAIDVGFYLRGLDVAMGFQTAGSTTLFFNVPQAGISQTFTGNASNGTIAGRADAIDQLKDYLKKNKDALKSLLTAFARYSPVDPLAGNPDSLFGKRMKGDFTHGFTNKVSQIWGCSTSAFNFTNDAPIQVASNGGTSDIFADAEARQRDLEAQNEIGFGVLAASTQSKVAATTTTPAGTITTQTFDLPLSYTAKFDSDPRKKLRFELPLTYSSSGGATSYSAGVGLAYTHPLSDDWSLTPAVGVGATGSADLGAAGGVASYSLTSAYTWRLDSLALSMGNSVGEYKSLGIKIGNVEAQADVKNTVYTNGFLLSGPNSLVASNLVVEYSLVDTRVTGDKVYSNSSDEVGIALGHISMDHGVIDSYTKLGLSYLIAKGESGNINSVRLMLTERF